MRRSPKLALCPILAVEMYVAVSREIGIDLSRGYLLRPTDQTGLIVDQPLTSSTAESLLKLYLRYANIDAGETLHSFRLECALTLTFSGSNLADVMSHVGWSCPSTAQYYLKLFRVIRAGAHADLLCMEYSLVTRLLYMRSSITLIFLSLRFLLDSHPRLEPTQSLKFTVQDLAVYGVFLVLDRFERWWLSWAFGCRFIDASPTFVAARPP